MQISRLYLEDLDLVKGGAREYTFTKHQGAGDAGGLGATLLRNRNLDQPHPEAQDNRPPCNVPPPSLHSVPIQPNCFLLKEPEGSTPHTCVLQPLA